MIKNGILYDHWKKEQKVFDTCLAALKHRITTKNIHDIRVSIKKLRAYLKLFFFLHHENETEPFLFNSKSLFKILGRQREIEICTDLTTLYEKQTNYSLPLWKKFLTQLLKDSKSRTSLEIHQCNNKELTKVALLIKQNYQFSISQDFEGKVKSKINELLKEFSKLNLQPHEMRKKLKEVYYWIPLCGNEENKNTFQPKVLHEILDDLGNWQDHEILQTRVKHFRKDYLPDVFEEFKLLKGFEDAIKLRKEVLLDHATFKIKNWIKDINEKSGD